MPNTFAAMEYLDQNTGAELDGDGKGKVHPRTGHEGPESEYIYSSTLSLTSVLHVVGGQGHASATLPPGKTLYPLDRRLGGPQGRSGRVRKSRFHRDSISGPSSP
jgi:hypothetical protein